MDRHAELPVLMYHKVSASGQADYLAIRVNDLDSQFAFIQQQGYSTISIQQLEDNVYQHQALPVKPLLLTFDDGYADNYEQLFPLLKKYNFKATIFLVSSFVDQQNDKDGNSFLTQEQIREMNACGIDFALHSLNHLSYKKLEVESVKKDLVDCMQQLNEYGIPFHRSLAYPFGAYPKKNIFKRKKFFRGLRSTQIKLAFRIGNRINKLPLKNPLLIQRIDVRGDEPFDVFRKNLLHGRKRSLF